MEENNKNGNYYNSLSSGEKGFDKDSEIRELVFSNLYSSKPFGMIWEDVTMEKFIKTKGYRVIEKFNPDTLEYYKYAIKEDSDIIPKDCCGSNLPEVFDYEVQKVLLKWLLSL